MNKLAWRCIKDHRIDHEDYFLLGEIVWTSKKTKMDKNLWERIPEWDKK